MFGGLLLYQSVENMVGNGQKGESVSWNRKKIVTSYFEG